MTSENRASQTKRKISTRYRLTVVVPMAAVGIVENVVSLLTLGYVNLGWSLRLGIRRARDEARRARSVVLETVDVER